MKAGRHIVFLSLGSNRGRRMRLLGEAETRIGHLVGPVTARSAVYETDPWGFDDETPFLNRVLEVRTHMSPMGVLEKIRQIEQDLGRERMPEPRTAYLPRTMDIDILLYDDRVLHSSRLDIPHPGIPARRFVLVPLCDLIPAHVHPGSGLTMRELLDRCQDQTGVRKVG